MRALVALAVVLLAACGRPPDPAVLRDNARDAMLRGQLAAAGEQVTQALEASPDASLRTALHLLQAEILLFEHDLQAAGAIIETPIAAGLPDYGALEARRLYLDGYRQMLSGAFEESLALLGTADTRARAAGAIDVALDAKVLAGQVLYRLGRFDEGDGVLLDARAEAGGSGRTAHEVAALGNLGMGQLVRERYDAALHWLEQALALVEVDEHLSYATALHNAGLSYARLGNLDRALALQERAVALHETRNVTLYLEQAIGELGHTHYLKGDTEQALALLNQARELAAAAGLSSDEALWLDSSATAFIDLAQWDEAERLNEASMVLKRERLDAASVGPNLINTGRIAAGRGQFAEAITTLEGALALPDAPAWVRWQAHASLASALVLSGQQNRGLEEFARALTVVDTMRSSLLEPEYRITFLARMIDFHRAYVDALVDAGRPTEALAVADASRARVLAERFGAVAADRNSAPALVARTRESGMVALAYWLAPARSFAWRVDGHGIQMVELPGSDAIDDLVHAHRSFIETSLGDPQRVDSSPADRLSAVVLAPLVAGIDRDARVVVVPDGSLHGVNFETLPVGPDRAYWIERATVSIAPALTLIDATPPRPVSASSTLLLVGDPETPAGALDRLRYAGDEIDAIRTLFPGPGTMVQRGEAASPDAFLSATPGAFSLIHFAAHATASATSPLDSSIELSADAAGRFKLYARDVAEAELGADLVTISACRGAGDRAYAGEGQVGLAWAFLRAGASRVIAGLWDVDDRSTALLMQATYAAMAAGRSPAGALRHAKLQMIAGGGNFAKPYYWAPFQLFAAAE